MDMVELYRGGAHLQEIGALPAFQKVLLRANDAAWSHHTEEGDNLTSIKTIMFHHVASDKGSRSAKSRLAVNGDGTTSDGLLGYVDELLENRAWRLGSINEIHVVMVNSGTEKHVAIILVKVKPNDGYHRVFGEIREVVPFKNKIVRKYYEIAGR
jgi:hypothetical protein